MARADAIVIGAGIVGAACAHLLAQAGLAVHVLDARRGGATAAGMGHLVVMDDNPAELALCRASMALWHRWAPQLDPGCAFTRCGTLWLAADDTEMQAATHKASVLAQAGLACELIGAAALYQAEPALRPGLAGGLRVAGDSVVYAPGAARWLLQQQAARPITVETAEVTQLAGASVQLADGRRLDAGAVVLAAGIESTRLLPGLPLRAKKGQLLITDRYPGTVHHQLVELGYIAAAHHSEGTSVAFNVQPRPTGQLLIGSSRQFDRTDPAVDHALLARMLRRALDYLPGIGDLNALRSWTGVRAATPDGLPVIGPDPRQPGLWLAVGHEGLGVTTAPGTASLLAAQITGSAAPFDPAPFALQRFGQAGCARSVAACP